jgi:hypothetical protein
MTVLFPQRLSGFPARLCSLIIDQKTGNFVVKKRSAKTPMQMLDLHKEKSALAGC